MTQTTEGKLLQAFLMASYAYYIRDVSVMDDTKYDKIAKTLLERWEQFDHQHKHLVTKDDLEAGSLFKMRHDQYPLVVINAAEIWISKTNGLSGS